MNAAPIAKGHATLFRHAAVLDSVGLRRAYVVDLRTVEGEDWCRRGPPGNFRLIVKYAQWSGDRYLLLLTKSKIAAPIASLSTVRSLVRRLSRQYDWVVVGGPPLADSVEAFLRASPPPSISIADKEPEHEL